MEQVHVIRHKVLVEGQSIRRVAREMQLSRNTVTKYLKEPEPVWHRSRPRVKPVLARVAGRIDALLEEWKGRTTAKQRITGTRVHRQLVEEGLNVGVTTVRSYLREKRRQQAEVFIPLVHRPGDEGQVDFFQVTVDVAGQRREVWKLAIRLMYSGRDFAWLYEHADQLAFLDAHVRAFEYFRGVPARMVYDNLTAAVQRRVGIRTLTTRFQQLSNHYLFEPCFARPREGHDKGGIEARGKGIRLQHLTPIPQGATLTEISRRLLADLDSAAGRSGVLDRFAEEAEHLRPLPARPFDPRRTDLVTVNRRALVRVDGGEYSLPSHWNQLEVTAHVGVEDIRFVCMGEEVTRSKAKRKIAYRDYLPELARKPQALRQVAPELLAELGAPYDRLWSMLVATHGELNAARVLARIVGCIQPGERDETAVTAILNEALECAHEARTPVAVPERLRGYTIASARAADFDVLLAGGGR